MSFLRNVTRVLVNSRGNTRSIFLNPSRGKDTSLYDEHPETYDYVEEDPKDRATEIDVETSIRYMNSEAYKISYGDNLIWTLYRRNKTCHFLGETRKKCIRQKKIATASPCPICRDMYLVLHERNVKLLEQFISPHSGAILPSIKTGLCQKQQKKLVVAIMRARDYGIIPYYVPFQYFDYEYYKELSKTLKGYNPETQS